MSARLDPEASGADLLDATLWRPEFVDGNFGVGKRVPRGGSVQGPSTVAAVVYSESQAQSEPVARLAAADGLHGAVIDRF